MTQRQGCGACCAARTSQNRLEKAAEQACSWAQPPAGLLVSMLYGICQVPTQSIHACMGAVHGLFE